MKPRLAAIFTLVFLLAGCSGHKSEEVYFPFKDKTWYRFNNLTFQIPIRHPGHPCTLVFYIRHTRDYEYRTFDFNMILDAPSGEERIREYHLQIRDARGQFTGTITGDSITSSMVLRKEAVFGQKGILKIEIENLIPRMQTGGILGAGIRLEPL
jgi:gliding motility-associated lipoprotein GldH